MVALAHDLGWILDVEEIDDQHMELLRCWLQLHEAVVPLRHEPWRLLTESVKTHFQFENDWMARSEYPYRHHHKREHDFFVSEMESVAELPGHRIDDDLVNAVRDMISGHVKGLDREFARFLQDRDAWDLREEWESERLDALVA